MNSWTVQFVRPSEDLLPLEDCKGSSVDAFIPSSGLLRVPLLAFFLQPDGDVYWPASEYLADVALVSRSATGDTVRTYAEALVAWLKFLTFRKKRPENALPIDAKSFRNELMSKEPGVADYRISCCPATANSRFGTVTRFYLWCQETEAFDSPLGRWILSSRQISSASAARPLQEVKSLSRFVHHRLPRIVTADEIDRITRATPQPYALMFRWAICTGLRRFEVCSLQIETLATLEEATARFKDELGRAEIIRKGGRVHSVHVPLELIHDTRKYLLFDRPSPIYSDQNYVFLGRTGRHISRSNLTAQFRAAADRAHVPATFHHLRHTYAVVVLSHLQAKAIAGASINPLKTLQVLMGHANLETTEIYLRALEVNSDAVKEALAFLYGDS